MTIRKMHWLVKERLNKANSNHYKDFTPMQIDEAIRNGTNVLVEHMISNSKGFEKTQQFTNVLRNLIVNSEYVPTNLEQTIHPEYDIHNILLNKDYHYILRIYAITNCGDFKLSHSLRQHLNTKLDNENTKPSKIWQRGLYCLAKGKVELFLPKNVLIQECYIDYIKKPKEVFFGGYDSLEYIECLRTVNVNCNAYYKTTDAPVNSDIDDGYHDLVVDFAVKELVRSLENSNKLQLINEKIITQIN